MTFWTTTVVYTPVSHDHPLKMVFNAPIIDNKHVLNSQHGLNSKDVVRNLYCSWLGNNIAVGGCQPCTATSQTSKLRANLFELDDYLAYCYIM